MAVEQSLASEIEAAVEETLETEKGFEDIVEKTKDDTTKAEDVKDEKEDWNNISLESNRIPEDDKNQDDSKQDKSDGVDGEVDENDEGEIKEEGKEAELEATSDLKKSLEISEEVLGLAVQAGFSISEARSFNNEQTLLKTIQIIRKKSVPEVEEEKKEQASFLGDLPELDPEQYEPEAIETFNKLKSAIQKQQETITQLVQETNASKENQAAQNEREVVAWFDQKVIGLGEQYKKTLGEGSHGSLDKGSSHYAKREEIADHINLMVAGYASTGREMPSLDTLFDQATKFVLQDEMSGVKKEQLSNRLRKRAKQHIARTGSEKVETLETAEASERELASQIDKQFFKGR